MTDDELNLAVSMFTGIALDAARKAGLPEEAIFRGFVGAALDIAKREPHPEMYGRVLAQFAELLTPNQGSA